MFRLPSIPNCTKSAARRTFGDDLNRFAYSDVKDVSVIGRGSFALAEKGTYIGKKVAIKKLHAPASTFETNTFAKEARILDGISNDNIVKFLAVCEEPIAMMLEYCEFSFMPFERDIVVNSLQQFLNYIDSEDITAFFPGICNFIVKDITCGLEFMHRNNMVHRDIKPANVLVSNAHYLDLGAEREKVFICKPVVCKLADLGEARSKICQTQALLVGESRTKLLNRGSPAFMAPEISVVEHMLKSANLEQLKAIDVWALLMTIFVSLNPDQRYPFQQDMEAVTKEQGERVRDLDDMLKDLLRSRCIPSFSPKYLVTQSCYYQNLREMIHDNLLYNAEDRCSVASLFQLVNEEAAIESYPLGASQATALEISDGIIVNAVGAETDQLQVTILPRNDGTNACAFLCLGIIDALMSVSAAEFETVFGLQKAVTDVIMNFPSEFNAHRDSTKMYDIYEASKILSENVLLSHDLQFEEKLYDNEKAYSYDLQVKAKGALCCLLAEARAELKPRFAIFQAEKYIFTIAALPTGDLLIFETHPISEDLGGNGNGIIVKSQKPCLLLQWISKRLINGRVPATCTPFLVSVTAKEEISETPADLLHDKMIFGSKRNHDHETSNGMGSHDSIHKRIKCSHVFDSVLLEISDDDSEFLSTESSDSSQASVQGSLDNGYLVPDGKPYRGNPLTPVFAWTEETFDAKNMVEILSTKFDKSILCIAPPKNVAHNVSFLVDVGSLKDKEDVKCDSMGVWKHTGSPKRFFRVQKRKDGSVDTVSPMPLDVSAKNDETYTLKRVYFVNVSDNEVRKTMATLEDPKGNQLQNVLVQYLFAKEEHEVMQTFPHGNSKGKTAYRRIMPSTRKQLKSSVHLTSKNPKEVLDDIYTVLGDVTDAEDLDALPRGPQDLYNARRSEKKKESGQSSSSVKPDGGMSTADALWMMLERAKREEELSKEAIFIRECKMHPDLFIILGNDRQFKQLVQFCTNPKEFSVYALDPTFNIFDKNISLTVTTYRNLRLHHKETNKPPVFIGPLLVHQRKDFKTYSKFAHALLTEEERLEGIIACGTDGEKALIEGLKKNFRFTIFLRCFLHFKDNIKRELTKRGMTGNAKQMIMEDIFGRQDQEIKYAGLVDCMTEEEVDEKLDDLKQKWVESENCKSANTFYEWFKKKKAGDMKESMLRSVRCEAGLGDPPAEYTNNDPESCNFMIKHGLHFEAKKPHEFVTQIKHIIETQFRNEDRAVFGKGPFKVRPDFAKSLPDESKWGRMTLEQRKKVLKKFEDMDMDCMPLDTLQDDENTTTSSRSQADSCPHLSVPLNGVKIQTIPAPILASMYQKANQLLSKPDHVVPKPGASNGSFIVAGSSDTIHVVTPGKGGSLTCDRSCIHRKTKLCEHILAVAEKKGSLNELLLWYKRSKAGPKITEMALSSGPKNAGKKPSARKKSNFKKPVVTNLVDVLDNSHGTINIPASSSDTQPTATSMTSAFLEPQPAAMSSSNWIPFAGQFVQQPRWTGPHHPGVSPAHQIGGAYPQPPTVNKIPLLLFTLKWVAGTTISRCYGCDRVIPNPPTQIPDDLVLVCRGMRRYRDRTTGQIQVSDRPQNIHFHMRLACVVEKCGNFSKEMLVVPNEFIPLLRREHFHQLLQEFAWSPRSFYSN